MRGAGLSRTASPRPLVHHRVPGPSRTASRHPPLIATHSSISVRHCSLHHIAMTALSKAVSSRPLLPRSFAPSSFLHFSFDHLVQAPSLHQAPSPARSLHQAPRSLQHAASTRPLPWSTRVTTWPTFHPPLYQPASSTRAYSFILPSIYSFLVYVTPHVCV